LNFIKQQFKYWKIHKTKLEYIFSLSIFVLFLAFAIELLNNPLGPQRQIFFMSLYDFFADFFNLLRYISDRDPYFNDFKGSYLPLSYLILYPFSKLDNFGVMTLEEARKSIMGIMSVCLFTIFSFSLLLVSLNKLIKKYLVSPIISVCFALSYIFFFSVERGNLMMLCGAFVAFFICYYDSKRKYERIVAIISLALAVTIKVYPVLFGLLYLEKKQYREIFFSALVTLLLVFLPFIFFKRGFANIPQLIKNTLGMTDAYNYKNIFPRFSLMHLIYRINGIIDINNIINIIDNSDDILTLIIVNIAQKINFLLCILSVIFALLTKNKYLKISLLTIVILFLPVNLAHFLYRITDIPDSSNSIISSIIFNIAQKINILLCILSIIFALLTKNKYLKISLLTMFIVFCPVNSGIYCGLYIFPMIVMFFATQKKFPKPLNVFTFIVLMIFLNPYQIVSEKVDSLNYLIVNISLLLLWPVLLVYTGLQMELTQSDKHVDNLINKLIRKGRWKRKILKSLL
jgi:hypothetical protein